MLINAANVIRLLRDKFVDVNETDVNPDERLLCDKLEELIVAAQEAPSFRDLFTEELVYLPSQEYDSSSDDELESEDDYIPDEKKSRRSVIGGERSGHLIPVPHSTAPTDQAIRVVKAFQQGLDRREPSLSGPSAARLREISRQLKIQLDQEGKVRARTASRQFQNPSDAVTSV